MLGKDKLIVRLEKYNDNICIGTVELAGGKYIRFKNKKVIFRTYNMILLDLKNDLVIIDGKQILNGEII